MTSPLVRAHILGQLRLRKLIARALRTIWMALPGYDEEDAPQFLRQAVPLVLAGQRQSVALTNAYLSRALERPSLGVDVDELIGAPVRNGTDYDVVYHRPFVTYWTALATGTEWAEAVEQGADRATSTAEMDIQLSSRATFQAVQDTDEGIFGFRRAADAGACEYCRLLDGAYVKFATASPMHPHCGCSLEPLTEPHPLAAWLPSGESVEDGYAIREHGELGALVGGPTHHHTGEEEALAA